jgi:16S rRNA (guanine527-N7)-methyltransferase
LTVARPRSQPIMRSQMLPPNPDLSDDRARALTLTPVSRETVERLDAFVVCLLQRQRTTNLIASSTIPQIWTRHIADSLQLLPLAPKASVWIDLGSGAGFPGLAIACALADRAGTRVHLVESIKKKAAFLQEAIAATGAPAVVHAERIEDVIRKGDIRPDVVTARALAPMRTLLGYVRPFVKTGAQALLSKGQDVEAELTDSAKYWNIDYELAASKTSPSGKIVIIRSVEARKGSG